MNTEENVALTALEKQVALAFTAADELEKERINRVEAHSQAEHNSLSSRVVEGEQRLRDHIAGQYAQIQIALDAAHRAIDKAEAEAEKAIQHSEMAVGQRVAKVDTDLREHIAAQVGQIRDALHAAQRETQIASDAQDRAVALALDAQKEQAVAHNGLIRKMEKQGENMLTREAADLSREGVDRRFSKIENWQAKVTGGMMLLGAIGIGNFVKLWT